MKFSIIVVCLNAGEELKLTLDSIKCQTCRDYEIIVKDGGSSDGSLAAAEGDPRIRVYTGEDKGIYDAMNQALSYASGEYVYFLNCGDYLYDSTVLEHVAQKTEEFKPDENGKGVDARIIYGNIYERMSGAEVMSNPRLDEFACYKNAPSHQACFYRRSMIMMHPFDTSYRVRADYEQFLWCFFYAKAQTVFMDMTIASYMGGGFSEAKENRKISAAELAEIAEKYMPHSHVVRYRWRMILSFQPLRKVLASNRLTSGLYNGIKSGLYQKRNK